MIPTVDLTNLREITGDNLILEHELFDLFVQSSEQCITTMRTCTDPLWKEEWRNQAHAFKGGSLNLGAFELGRLCQEAQENAHASTEQKRAMLTAIESEFGRVKEQLEKACRAAY